jgi:aspartate/methionine/tyrosine aminotransferase
MDRLGCRYNKAQEGMFVWARIPEHAPSAEKFVDSILQENHVFLTPGFIFGAKGERYIRASLCNPKNILEEAFNRIFNF